MSRLFDLFASFTVHQIYLPFITILKNSLPNVWNLCKICAIFVEQKQITMIPQLETNEFFRINSYYWQGMVYIALQTEGDKTLCQIKGSKSKPKWIKSEQLSKIYKDFQN